MSESITHMGPMLVLAGLLVAWLAEVVSRDGGYGYNLTWRSASPAASSQGASPGSLSPALACRWKSGSGCAARRWPLAPSVVSGAPPGSHEVANRTGDCTREGCGAELEDPTQPFCGGDRCLAVLMRGPVSDMRWRMEFYHERRGVLACYEIWAGAPGRRPSSSRWGALLRGASFAAAGTAREPFEQDQFVQGRNPDGWILYRIVRDDSRASTTARSAAAGGASAPTPRALDLDRHAPTARDRDREGRRGGGEDPHRRQRAGRPARLRPGRARQCVASSSAPRSSA